MNEVVNFNQKKMEMIKEKDPSVVFSAFPTKDEVELIKLVRDTNYDADDIIPPALWDGIAWRSFYAQIVLEAKRIGADPDDMMAVMIGKMFCDLHFNYEDNQLVGVSFR